MQPGRETMVAQYSVPAEDYGFRLDVLDRGVVADLPGLEEDPIDAFVAQRQDHAHFAEFIAPLRAGRERVVTARLFFSRMLPFADAHLAALEAGATG